MKSDVMPSIVKMEYGVLQELVKEVKETLAKDINVSSSKKKSTFGSVDMWNIRRTSKSARVMFRG
jgi:hypothetical protein